MTTEMLLIVVVIVLGFVGLYFFLYRLVTQQKSEQPLEDMVHKVFSLSTQKIAEQSKHVLEGEKEAIKVDLENKQKTIEKLVKQLQDDLKLRQDEIRSLEQDRTRKFGELTTQMEHHRQMTQELKISTEQLSKVLSNNQTRGSWGERIIEDLMQANGLLEGVHYSRQTTLGSSTLKPDILLLLPNKRVVPVDVKFPYAEIQKLAQAETAKAREEHLRQFTQDLRLKIKKVAEYIAPEQNTLDYAILFVPNEMVFSFINQKFPDLVDEALAKKVIIVSPFTFLIVARTVIESYRNFMMEDRLREVVQHVSSFTNEWLKFKEQFEKYGRAISGLKTAYDELSSTRVRQMERRIEQIESVQSGVLQEGEKLSLPEEV